jgi:hypothetical protein
MRIRSDPDIFGRIRILALINDHISTFLVCVKAIKLKETLMFHFLVHELLFRAKIQK